MPRRTLKVEKDLIPITTDVEGAPVVDLENALPHTYYRRRNDDLYVFLTIMPDGLYVGWDSCGRCSLYVSICRCDRGIIPPKSVSYIYSKVSQRIDEGHAQRATEVDTATKKPTWVSAKAESKGQVSAPRKRPKRMPVADAKPVAPRKLRRIKKS